MIERDTHHPFFDKSSWEVRPESTRIRNSIIARGMARTAHNLLHAHSTVVPVPMYSTLFYVSNRLWKPDDVFQGIDMYSSLVEQSSKRPKCRPIERRLNDLSIEALRTQIPFIRDGVPSERTIIA